MRERLIERLPLLLGLAVLGVFILVGSIFLADGIRDRGRADVLTVTGSARQGIDSDYVVWDASISSQQATPALAARELAGWSRRFREFLRTAGALDSEVSEKPISTETLTASDNSGEVVGFRLTRTFEVRSARVAAITALVEESSGLLAQGVPISVQPPQYVYTKLPDLRPQLIAAATKDALNRAKVLVEATGGQLGKLRSVNVGVFQVTTPNSTEVSDYGVYDTSTIRKDVIAVVNVSFGLR